MEERSITWAFGVAGLGRRKGVAFRRRRTGERSLSEEGWANEVAGGPEPAHAQASDSPQAGNS